MGYGYYILPDGREAGYGVEAVCDHPKCLVGIDRGLGYLCGDNPDGHRDPDDPGCGRYYCLDHLGDHECPNPGRDEDEMTADRPQIVDFPADTDLSGTPGTPKLSQEHTDGH